MVKKKRFIKENPESPAKAFPAGTTAVTPSPYLLVAHPPAKNPTLLAVSVILFLVWFLFLLVAALAG